VVATNLTKMKARLGIIACIFGILIMSILTGCSDEYTKEEKTGIEADYILFCQYKNRSNEAYGAINNLYAGPSDSDRYGEPTYIVPRENAMAILGLIVASDVTGNDTYKERAKLAADYLVSVQDPKDGAWCDQYSYTTAVKTRKSPTQTAEVMIALYKLGYDPDDEPDKYDAMMKGAEYLISCQNVTNKGGNDDGLLCGGKNGSGAYECWRWTHDNCYAYWALKAAEIWASDTNNKSFALECSDSSNRILRGINESLSSPDGVWYIAIDKTGDPQINAHLRDCCSGSDEEHPSWIQYAPQMLNIPAEGVNSPEVGNWIYNTFKRGSCVGCLGYDCENNSTTNSSELKERRYPGFAFQAAIALFNSGNETDAEHAHSAIKWAEDSGLWQRVPDNNTIAGGWIDWVETHPEEGSKPDQWVRLIDTSFYAIACWNGGYDFTIP